MTIYDPRIKDFANVIKYSNSSRNVVSDLLQSDFWYFHSFTPKNRLKFDPIFRYEGLERAKKPGDMLKPIALAS